MTVIFLVFSEDSNVTSYLSIIINMDFCKLHSFSGVIFSFLKNFDN